MRRIDKQGIADSFSLAAGSYDGHVPAQKYFAANLFALALRNAPAHCAHIADLGCGTGFLSEMIAGAFAGASLTCVDIAHGMLEQCRARAGLAGADFLCADLERGGFGYNFDLVVSNYALQWTHLNLALQTIAESLADGGVLAIALPVAGSFCELAAAYEMACNRPLPGPDYPLPEVVGTLAVENQLQVFHEQVEEHCIFFSDARQALRSFKRCGAVFNQHEDYVPLSVEEVRRLLDCYDTATLQSKNRVGITFRTLYLLARHCP